MICLDYKKVEAQCKSQSKNDEYKVKLAGVMGDRYRTILRLSVWKYTLDESGKPTNIATEEDLRPDKATHFVISYTESTSTTKSPTTI